MLAGAERGWRRNTGVMPDADYVQIWVWVGGTGNMGGDEMKIWECPPSSQKWVLDHERPIFAWREISIPSNQD